MNIKVQFRAEMEADFASPTIAMIEALSIPGMQTVTYSDIAISPNVDLVPITDFYNNQARRLTMPAGASTVFYNANISLVNMALPAETDVDSDMLTIDPSVLHYTNPSRYCPSDRLTALAGDMFGTARPGLSRIQDVCAWINAHIRYQYGTSNTSTMADDTLLDRTGVCRDFAHLGITLCRGLGVPARYVSGYCLGLEFQDLHAYFEAYIGGTWIAFDPTANFQRPALVRIATGRDAADCAWWTVFGNSRTNEMFVEVSEVELSKEAP